MRKVIIALALATSMPALAQNVVDVPFDLSQTGHRFSPTWGVDVAWPNEQNVRKGINHMGAENIGIGRSAYRFVKPLTNDSVLPTDAISNLRSRSNLLNLVRSTLPIVLTADQEAGADPYFVVNKVCDVNHWTANIVSHVHWMQQNSRHPIVGVSPFNEPDYWTVEEGASVGRQVQVAQRLREQYPRMDTIAIVGGNTLNNDKALEWYTSGKQYYDWGNTHQLAGSFATFAAFFQQLQKDGKVGYADEMHNVGEAMVGLEYGMTVGIWWGFDSRARGEFCDISRHGERLAYAEHRNNWTAASVYRHDDGRVKAFIGSSERQAVTTTYRFLSLDRDVFFDGNGPTRVYTMQIPGGTGYQKGQTNAERVIDITWGDDVAPVPIVDSVYQIVNKATGNVAAISGSNIVMQRYTSRNNQQWYVKPINPRIGGDYSFYDIRSVTNGKTCMDVENFSMVNNGKVIAYTPTENPSTNQQWYLQYAGNGYYYIRNRESALYLASASSSSNNGISVIQRTMQTDSALLQRLLWRLLPIDISYETEAPVKPTGLQAELLPAAVKLTWETSDETDLDGYIVMRADKATGEWNTLARRVASPYIDNTCLKGHTYIYKVKAIDRAQNMSDDSDELTVAAPNEPAIVGRWSLSGTLADLSANTNHATTANTPEYTQSHQEGLQALRFVQNQSVTLPYNVAHGEELTVSMWVYMLTSKAWTRLFDFGYDSNHCIFLSPTGTGTRMQLVARNGSDEQVLLCPTRLASVKWKHVVVTMKAGETAIYVDGEQVAKTSDITITPADVHPITNYLGRSQNGTDPFLMGNMADVRIYNYAMTADEVTQLLNEPDAISTPITTPQQPDAIHSLDGIRLTQPRRGLNIIGGQVHAVKQ